MRKKRSPEYTTWIDMRRRCEDPRRAAYARYGGRGIRVCRRWKSFANFLADMGRRPSDKHSIDRYPDKNGNYEKSNCRWATWEQQARNRRDNRLYTIEGQTRCMTEWCQQYGVSHPKFTQRVKRGMSPLEALTAPDGRTTKKTVFPPGGVTQCKERGLCVTTIRNRLERGWGFDRALAEPINPKHRRKAAA